MQYISSFYPVSLQFVNACVYNIHCLCYCCHHVSTQTNWSTFLLSTCAFVTCI